MKTVVSLTTFELCAKINPEEVMLELSGISIITPENIVETAKNPTSPLHKYFDWDDKSAAHKFRLSQARHLVLAIGLEENGQTIRAFESVVIDGHKVYAPIEHISQNESLVEQVLQCALRELSFWKMKHQKYQNFFGGIFGEITKAEEIYRGQNGKKETSRRKGKGRNKADNSSNKKAHSKNHNNRRFAASR